MRTKTAEKIKAGLADYKKMGAGWSKDSYSDDKTLMVYLEGKHILQINVNPVKSAGKDYSQNTLSYIGPDVYVNFHGFVRRAKLKPDHIAIEYEIPIGPNPDRNITGNVVFLINDNGPDDRDADED